MKTYTIEVFQIAEPTEKNWAYKITHDGKTLKQTAAFVSESSALHNAAQWLCAWAGSTHLEQGG